jgi:hypothetical protein
VAPSITFVAYRPGRNSDWDEKPMTAKIAELPGAKIRWDDEGRETRRFGVTTSGDVRLYSPSGLLLFRGGITGSRGHEGDNNGLSDLLVAMNTTGAAAYEAAAVRSPVFGCTIGKLNATRTARGIPNSILSSISNKPSLAFRRLVKSWLADIGGSFQ